MLCTAHTQAYEHTHGLCNALMADFLRHFLRNIQSNSSVFCERALKIAQKVVEY